MEQNEDDSQELERKINQASRIASTITDQTTLERLGAWVEGLKPKLRQLLNPRRTKQEIGERAKELWEQNSCPAGRDLEFWLQAEAEITAREWQDEN